MVPFKLVFSLILACVAAATGVSAQSNNDPELRRIVSRYVEATGGIAVMERIDSIWIRADLNDRDESRLDLSILKKKPNRVRMTISGPGFRVVRGYDGQEAWVSSPATRNAAVTMDARDAAEFVRDAPIDSPLIDAERRDAKLTLIGIENVRGVPCHHIKVEFADGSQTEYFIDTESFVERKTSQTRTRGGKTSLIEVYPSEFQKVGGLLFAFKTETYIDGELDSTIDIREVEVNPGVLETVFAKPAQ